MGVNIFIRLIPFNVCKLHIRELLQHTLHTLCEINFRQKSMWRQINADIFWTS